MIKTSERNHIDRMIGGEPLLRIGSIWYGNDQKSTVTSIYYFGNKEIQTVLPIRAESALSFSTSKPPVDTLQVEIIVHYSAFRTHIQRLTAHIQVSPVLPVMNPVIAAITQPVIHNKRVYAAYGFSEVNDDDVVNGTHKTKLMSMYASTPVQMRIDTVTIETIKGAPRDIRIMLRVTRALTANIYGDRVTYVRTMDDAVKQHAYINEVLKEGGDNDQGDAVAAMCGVDVEGMRAMIDAMRSPSLFLQEVGANLTGIIKEILAPDLYRVEIANGSMITVMPYGVECLNGIEKLKAFGLESLAAQAGLHDYTGQSINRVIALLTSACGIGSGAVSAASGSVHLTVIERGPISRLDGSSTTDSQAGHLIHYCIITHPYLLDIGNTLICQGHAFESPYYQSNKVPEEYRQARGSAQATADQLVNNQISLSTGTNTLNHNGTGNSSDIGAATLVKLNRTTLPWEMRKTLRQKLGKNGS